MMKLSDFDYELPMELIAKYPLPERSRSRLLKVAVADASYSHHIFHDLPQLLQPGDLLVLNNTKVIPARLFAHKPSGGKVEILLERMLSIEGCLAHCRASHLQPGHELIVADGVKFKILGRQGNLYRLGLTSALTLMQVLQTYGHVPLPPYLERNDELSDQERYQTVYAKHIGSVAAPTAGLHFDRALLEALESKGIEHTFVTLHVGAGTFQPVKTEDISKHQMHTELYEISQATADKINTAKREGRRIIAVGTTSVRTLETAASNNFLQAGNGETQIFIYPGYTFKMISGMITNFHLPQSSLLMLVSSFAGHELIRAAYQEAIKQRYRFYSYGDAMLLLR